MELVLVVLVLALAGAWVLVAAVWAGEKVLDEDSADSGDSVLKCRKKTKSRH